MQLRLKPMQADYYREGLAQERTSAKNTEATWRGISSGRLIREMTDQNCETTNCSRCGESSPGMGRVADAQLRNDVMRSLPCYLEVSRRKRNRSHPRMAATAVAFADFCQVLDRLDRRPGI